MYLAFGPDGYIRYGLDDPMAALASRTASFNEYLHNPPWAAEWIVHQAREHRIDGALVLRPRSMKPAATGRLFIERALEDAGIPVLPIEADVVDARAWDPAAARAGGAVVSRHAGAASDDDRPAGGAGGAGCCPSRRRSWRCSRCSCRTSGSRRSCRRFSRSSA